ncbi:GDSL-type esterase/lipase family protein [Burkholderia sp. RS01]|uniref:SGNH/GDSL hydrolase family protein n=1 Tax=unclassified Burkholderia TaxID=2613784 RepID=UPI00321840AA
MGILDAPALSPLLRPNTLVGLGDSLIEQGGGAPVAVSHRSYGMLTWAQFFSGQRLQLLRNSGVGGERTDQILARVATGVLSYKPGYVTAGTNDVAQAIPMATIKANLAAIWSMLDATGIRVVATTIPRATPTPAPSSQTPPPSTHGSGSKAGAAGTSA